MNDLAETQPRALVRGNMRHNLGRFATAFRESRKRPKPVLPIAEEGPIERSFDEIAEGDIQKKHLPPWASLKKQKISIDGESRQRFQGRLVRP
tara:strand:+ start:128 stop:406 length:279 start_codon:yes stop_codon:yes gene_type:complete